MKIFLTGGTGFVGGYFINCAHIGGHTVLAMRRPNSIPRIPLAREPIWVEGNYQCIPMDILRTCDVLVHLAAHSANVPYDKLCECLEENVVGPLKLGELAVKAGIKKFVIAGTCFEYGRAAERYEKIPYNAPLEPTQSYAISKAAASVAWMGFARMENVRLTVMRIFHVYGEGEPEGRLWPTLRKLSAVGSDMDMTLGDQIRDFVPVVTVARQLLAEAESPCAKEGVPIVRHIGSGKPQSVRAFAETVWKEAGGSGQLRFGALPYRPAEVMRFVPEIDDQGK